MFSAYVTSTLLNTASFMQMVSTTYVAKSRGIPDDTIGTFLARSTTDKTLQRLRHSRCTLGYIQSFSAFMQMIGGPVFGFWIQAYGLKSALLACYLSTIVSGVTLRYSPVCCFQPQIVNVGLGRLLASVHTTHWPPHARAARTSDPNCRSHGSWQRQDEGLRSPWTNLRYLPTTGTDYVRCL